MELTDDPFSTGYGQHGDYLFGWKDDALQRGMDGLGTTCASEDCTGEFTIQSGDDAIGCTKAQQAVEDIGTDSCKSTSLMHRVLN